MTKVYTPDELAHKTFENQNESFSQCFNATKNKYFKDIKTKHLDDMIMRNNFTDLFSTDTNFSRVYLFVSQRETNSIMKNWTIAIGVMTVIILICTIVNLFITICNK